MSYVLCPWHLPVTLGLAAVLSGGSALGATIARNARWVGAGLTLLCAVVLCRGFRHLRVPALTGWLTDGRRR